MNTRYIIITSFLLSLFFVSCDEKKNTFRSANDLYNEKDYKRAEKEYRRVLTMDSTYNKALFNLANATYNQKDTNLMQTAMDNWQKAYDSFANDDSLSKSNVVYNQGNVKFKQAIAMLDDTSQSKDFSMTLIDYEKLKEATEDYKNVLRQFPNDTAARYNLSLANYLISKQPKKNSQQQKQQQQDQQQQNQQSNPQQQNKQQQNQQSNSQPQNNQQQNQPQNQQPQQSKQNKDKQQINSMLEALKNNEKNTLRKLKKNEKKQTNKYRSEKDW